MYVPVLLPPPNPPKPDLPLDFAQFQGQCWGLALDYGNVMVDGEQYVRWGLLEFKYWFEATIDKSRIWNLGFDLFVHSPNQPFTLSNNKSAMILYNNFGGDMVMQFFRNQTGVVKTIPLNIQDTLKILIVSDEDRLATEHGFNFGVFHLLQKDGNVIVEQAVMQTDEDIESNRYVFVNCTLGPTLV